jgi:hypothetical protein
MLTHREPLVTLSGTEPLQGHEQARALLRQLQSHTLLFAGPERVGRRRVARWYAQWLNCEEPLVTEPCGRCASCRAMQGGSHPDYREISPDVSTKTGRLSRRPQVRIDDLVFREGGNPEPLSRWLEIRPRSRWRVGVIDHAEALGEQAANAFLKFLEEPPGYARIILIAPSPEAVLSTIASRSTVVRFGTVEVQSEGEHPLARLGRAGDFIGAQMNREAFEAAVAAVDLFLLSLAKGLDDVFVRADALEKAWSSEAGVDVAELLRARLSAWQPLAYAEALGAVERCEKALEAYASAPLAMQVLALDLRAVQAERG